jgi:HlyD family secretion protein
MTTENDTSESVIETRTSGRALGRRSLASAISPFQVVVLVVVVAAGLIAWQLTRPGGATYRTATVGTGTVVATLSSVGTINPVNQANLNFNVAGTVSAVDVAVGQQVTAGEVLASLDPTPLQNAVVTDEASVASAQASLASDEASQAGAATSAATLTSVITAGPPSGGSATSSSGKPVTQLQATLVADQKQEDADSTAVGTALAAATSTCTPPAPVVSSASSSTPKAGSTQPSLSPTAPATSTAATCTQSLGAASSAQATLATDIKTVAADEAALTAALESAASSSGSGGPSSTSTGSSGAGSTGSGSKSGSSSTGAASGTTGTTAPGSGSSSSKTKAVTAQKLALDQASIDVALANLDNAQKSLAAANLVSTISGTVGAVTLTAGSSVSAGSTTATGQVVVLGSGASYQLVATVPVAKISQVAVGQPATVTPDSSGTVVNGTVTSIGVLATSGTTSTTYPVTVSFQSSSIGLYSGAEAELSIVTGRAVGVTTVPTSAVHTVGTNHLVTVVNGATTKQVRVSTGTVGTVLTQVTSGIKLGQRVSMADLNQPVPSSSTTSTRSGLAGLGGTSGLPGGSGGFGGAGGFSGGGFRGGAPGG